MGRREEVVGRGRSVTGAAAVRAGEGARRLATIRQMAPVFDVRPRGVDLPAQMVELVFHCVEALLMRNRLLHPDRAHG